jgi:hypothetical protein
VLVAPILAASGTLTSWLVLPVSRQPDTTLALRAAVAGRRHEEIDRQTVEPRKGRQLDDIDPAFTRLAFGDVGLRLLELARPWARRNSTRRGDSSIVGATWRCSISQTDKPRATSGADRVERRISNPHRGRVPLPDIDRPAVDQTDDRSWLSVEPSASRHSSYA